MKAHSTRLGLLSALLVAPLALALAAPPQSPAPPSAAPAQEKPAPAPPGSPANVPVPLPRGTRLVLRDGNFLLVREYKIAGDRVRYWSVEREAWEEIPSQLVDWDATHKGEAEDAARKKQIDQTLKEIAQRERAASLTVDASLEVAPGVFLPDDPGFYVLAGGAVQSISQDLAESHLGKARLLAQIFTPVPIVPTKHSVELKGAHSKFRILDPQPEFYVRTADGHEPQLSLVRVRVHHDSRLVTEINTDVAGQSSNKDIQVRLERWVAASGTYRYTMGEKLKPGEYAFIQTIPDKGLDLYVWDFGVDPPGGALPKD
ncbi:MAG TPA: hypothetical protein VMV61_11525 [Patescibacteria group bacterium]|nr:hypothetical protein [Patescibacteria group bacterium]